jgi:hypothetical protein
MPIIGFKFESMEAKREKTVFGGEVKINSTPKILSVKEIAVPNINKKALELGFEFSTQYDPGIGSARIKGEVLYLSDKNAQILKKWKSKKTLPDDVNIEVLNHLFRQCLLKIANLADDLQLPPPIQMPRVKPKSDHENYIG